MNEELFVKMINEMIKTSRLEGNISTKDISDVYHTFRQLYNHRTILFALVCNAYPELSWKSKKHFDEENDPMFDDSFIAGINTPEGIVTYHIKLKYWEMFNVPELERAPRYDSYSNKDVIDRVLSLNKSLLSENYKKVK